MRITLLALFLASTVICRAGDTNAPPKIIEVSVISNSPQQTCYIEQHTLSPNEVFQVWLVSSKNSKDRQLLYTHSRSVKVLFSNDEKWLVINDYAGSNLANVILFQKKHGVDYKQVEDITDKAWVFLAAQVGHKKGPLLDHNYAEVLRWTDDTTILLCLYGHMDQHNHVEDWLCLYDVKTKTFSTDLDKHNKRHTTLEAE